MILPTQLLLPPPRPAEELAPQQARENKPKTKFKPEDKVIAIIGKGNTPIKAEIVASVANSRMWYIVRDIDRGAGWDEKTQSYVGVRSITFDKDGAVNGGGWGRGQNYGFGNEYEVHASKITPVNN